MNILDNYTTFDSFLNTIETLSPNVLRKVSHAGGNHVGIQFKYRYFPISINEQEFNFMHDVIIKNNLKNGFELSTGTGVSTISIGIAMKKTNGKLLTLDSYYEEYSQISIEINNSLNLNHNIIKNLEGYKFIENILKTLNLNNVTQCIGWSPTDAVDLLKKLETKLDFVFLDCPKSLNEVKRDISYIQNFINKEKSIIFIHDINTSEYRNEVNDMLKDLNGWTVHPYGEYYKNTPYYKNVFFPIHYINFNCEL